MTRLGANPVWRVLGVLDVRRRGVALSIVYGVAGSLSALGLAALAAWLITRAWQQPPILSLSIAITAVRAFGISRGLFRYLERLASHRVALAAMATARERVYLALVNGNAATTVSIGRGDLLARTGADIDEIGNALVRSVLPATIAAVTGVSAVSIMVAVSPVAAVVLAGALLVAGVVAPMLAARGADAIAELALSSRADVADATMLLLDHGPELSVAGRRGAILADVTEGERKVAAATDRGAVLAALAAAVTPLAMGLTVVAAALIGISLSDDGNPSPMRLGVLILLGLSAFDAVTPLAAAGVAWQHSRVAAERLIDLIGDPAGWSGDADSSADLPRYREPVWLHAADISWGWPSGPPLGGPTSLHLAPGARIVVVGPNGVGKSTLLMTLAGLLAPKGGTLGCVDVHGEPVEVEAATFYSSDDAHIFSTSVRENLLVGRGNASTSEMTDAVAAVGLGEWLAGLPAGLDTVLHGGSAAVSGGQRRRLLLARALLNESPVVLLDEPTEHIDAADADDLMRDIVGEMFGPTRTVVVVTHHLPTDVAADVEL